MTFIAGNSGAIFRRYILGEQEPPRPSPVGAFLEAGIILDMSRVHELRPLQFSGEEPRYFLCAYPEDGICTLSVSVLARDLARYVFP